MREFHYLWANVNHESLRGEIFLSEFCDLCVFRGEILWILPHNFTKNPSSTNSCTRLLSKMLGFGLLRFGIGPGNFIESYLKTRGFNERHFSMNS